MEKNKHIGMRIDAPTHGKLKFIAEYEGRSINGQILHLIRQNIREFEHEHGPIDLTKTTGED